MKSMSKVIRSNEHYLDEYDDRLKGCKKIDLNEFTAKDIMVTGHVAMSENRTVQEAVQMFVDEHVMSILVIDKKGRPVGTFSERELAKFDCERPEIPVTQEDVWLLSSIHDMDTPDVEDARMVTTKDDPLKYWMSKDVFTVNHDDDVDTICQTLVKHNTRRLFVKHNDKIVGVVSAMDVISAIANVTTKRKAELFAT